MKKILYIAVLAIICWSCNKNSEVVEPKQEYQKGQIVEIKVAAHSQNSANSQARKIIGEWKDAEYVEFGWQWEGTEQIKIEYGGESVIFTCKQKDDDKGIAIFEGEMPGGWEPGQKAKVIAGDIEHEWPVSDQGQIKLDGIASKMMRFEGTMTNIDQTIDLKAAWSAFRFPIYFHAKDYQWESGTNLSKGTNVHFWTKSLDLEAKCNDEDVKYHYTIEGGYDYTISESGTGAGTSSYIYYIFVVKPGTYTDVSVSVTFERRQTLTPEEEKIKEQAIEEEKWDLIPVPPLQVRFKNEYTTKEYDLYPQDQSPTQTRHASIIKDEEKGIDQLSPGRILTPSALEFVYTFKKRE